MLVLVVVVVVIGVGVVFFTSDIDEFLPFKVFNKFNRSLNVLYRHNILLNDCWLCTWS